MRRATLIALLLLGACGLSTDPTKDNFQAALNRWNLSEPSSYEMSLRFTCVCPFAGTVKVVVTNGQVTSRTVEAGTPATGFESSFPDVRGLFDVIEDALNRRARSTIVDYDPALGYPGSILIDYQGNVLDEEIAYRVLSFTPITTNTAPR